MGTVHTQAAINCPEGGFSDQVYFFYSVVTYENKSTNILEGPLLKRIPYLSPLILLYLYYTRLNCLSHHCRNFIFLDY